MSADRLSEEDVARYWDDNARSEEYCQAHPSQRGWRDHAAVFLYVRAEKPGPA
jgi:hypothetical protein